MRNARLLMMPTVSIKSRDIKDSVSGSKGIDFQIVVDDDTIAKSIAVTNGHISSSDLSELKDEIIDEYTDKEDPKVEIARAQRDQKEQHDGMVLSGFITLFICIAVMFVAWQRRMVKEKMIASGMNPMTEENERNRKFFSLFRNSDNMKWVVIFMSFGIALLADSFTEHFMDFGVFFGMFALLLGLGFFYLYSNKSAFNSPEPPKNKEEIEVVEETTFK